MINKISKNALQQCPWFKAHTNIIGKWADYIPFSKMTMKKDYSMKFFFDTHWLSSYAFVSIMTFLNLENKVNHSFLGLMHTSGWTECITLKWQPQGSFTNYVSKILKFFYQLTNLFSILLNTHVNYIISRKWLYFVDLMTFYILGQKFVKFFVGFLENLRYQKYILKSTDI